MARLVLPIGLPVRRLVVHTRRRRIVLADYLPAEVYEDFVHVRFVAISLALGADLSGGNLPRRRAEVS